MIVALGKIAFDSVAKLLLSTGVSAGRFPVKFAHSVEVGINDELRVLGSYHPSQQNTFTGRLTEPMFDSVFERVRQLLK